MKSLYRYVNATFRRGEDGATFNNSKRETIGLYGHLKLLEALAFLFEATRDELYLTHLKEGIEFCRRRTQRRGIGHWFSSDLQHSSQWVETHHLGILALIVYRYAHITGDDSYNAWLEQLLRQIPKNHDGSGTYCTGYSMHGLQVDDRRFLDDHAEILAGFFALWKLTGKEGYLKECNDIRTFLQKGFRMLPGDQYPAWVIGPYAIPFRLGSKGLLCHKSHPTYLQFYISRMILWAEWEKNYEQVVQSVDWLQDKARFVDGFFGFTQRDDKLSGWSIYAAVQMYWAYLLTRRDDYYFEAMHSIRTVLSHQLPGGRIPPYFPAKKTINWDQWDNNPTGTGEIWQLSAILEGLSLSDRLGKPHPVSVWQLHEGKATIHDVLYEEDKRTIHLALTREAAGEERYRLISPRGQFIRFVCTLPTRIQHGTLSDGRPFLDIILLRESGEPPCTLLAIHE